MLTWATEIVKAQAYKYELHINLWVAGEPETTGMIFHSTEASDHTTIPLLMYLEHNELVLYSQLVDNWSHFASTMKHCCQKNKYSSSDICHSKKESLQY